MDILNLPSIPMCNVLDLSLQLPSLVTHPTRKAFQNCRDTVRHALQVFPAKVSGQGVADFVGERDNIVVDPRS